MIRQLPTVRQQEEPLPGLMPCEHRTVSKDGRILCVKIVEGDDVVSPEACRTCPFQAANCIHLRFSLQQTSPSPLIVRFNGRTEIWDDDPPELRFTRAACEARVLPVEDPRVCASCALRQSVHAPAEQPRRRQRKVVGGGKVQYCELPSMPEGDAVVPFPPRGAVAAAG
jgi:hypothetical protein